MESNIKDICELIGAVIAVGGFVLSIYNFLRAKKTRYQVDSLLLDTKRYEILQTAIDTETLRTKVQTSLRKQRNKLRIGIIGLTGESKDLVDNAVKVLEKGISNLDDDISADEKVTMTARELLDPTQPETDLILKVNTTLGTVRANYSEALRQQSKYEATIVDTDHCLTTAQLPK